MPVLYAVVAKRGAILASDCLCLGNFDDVSSTILSRINPETSEQRMSYKNGDHLYHYLIDDELTFLAIADLDFPQTSVFQLLEKLAVKFELQFGKRGRNENIPFAMNTEFGPIIKAELRRANSVNNVDEVSKSEDEEEVGEEENLIRPAPTTLKERPGEPSSKMDRCREEVEKVKTIMVANIDALVERGQRLDLLVDKAEHLSNNSVTFKQKSRRLARRIWWQNVKMWICIVIGILLVVYIICVLSCGGFNLPKCIGGNHAVNGTF